MGQRHILLLDWLHPKHLEVPLTIIKPRTKPRSGEPPNTLKADQQIKAGKKAKAVSVNTTVYV